MTSSLTPGEDVRNELAALLEVEQGRIGEVYRLTTRGMTPPQIAAELGVSSSGFVSNYRAIARALLEGHLPTGPTMARQVIGGVHKVVGRARLSDEATAYQRQLLQALDEVAKGDRRWTLSRTDTPTAAKSPISLPSQPREHSLREQAEEELRRRTRHLVEAIQAELDLECDDYLRVGAGASPLDALQRLVQFETTSRTTRALHAVGRMDLSIEAHVLKWRDLPFATDLTDSAHGRLDYWSGT